MSPLERKLHDEHHALHLEMERILGRLGSEALVMVGVLDRGVTVDESQSVVQRMRTARDAYEAKRAEFWAIDARIEALQRAERLGVAIGPADERYLEAAS